MPTFNINNEPAPVTIVRGQDGNIEYTMLDRAFNSYSITTSATYTPLTTSATYAPLTTSTAYYTPPRWSDYDIELEGDHFVMKPKVEAVESYLK